jgi:hypothetical protein
MGNSITGSVNCECSIAVALCTAVYVACFRYINVNTVHRGGDGDDRGRGMAQAVFRQSLNREARLRFPVSQ